MSPAGDVAGKKKKLYYFVEINWQFLQNVLVIIACDIPILYVNRIDEYYLPTNTIILSMIGTSAPETFMLPVKPDSVYGTTGSVIKSQGVTHFS